MVGLQVISLFCLHHHVFYLNMKQQINILFILKKLIYKWHRVWVPVCPMGWGPSGSIGSPLHCWCLLCGCRWRERLGCRGGADHGESRFLSWACQAAALGPAGWQVPSFLEAEERFERKGCWEPDSWIAEESGPRQQCWGLAGREQEGRDSYDWCPSFPFLPLSRNAGDPHWEFSWMTSARRCWSGTRCLSCWTWSAKVWLRLFWGSQGT